MILGPTFHAYNLYGHTDVDAGCPLNPHETGVSEIVLEKFSLSTVFYTFFTFPLCKESGC